MKTLPFSDSAAYYDLLYSGKDARLEAAYVATLLRSFGAGRGDVADFGCGTGTHALALAAEGYSITGVDHSPSMLTVARSKIAAATKATADLVTLTEGDLRSVALGRQFSAAVALFHVVGYLGSDADLRAAFKNVRRHLPEGAPFLFDFWYAPAVERDPPTPREKVAENEAFLVHRTATPHWYPERRLVEVHYRYSVRDKHTGTLHQFEELHPMRYFSAEQIERELKHCGFAIGGGYAWSTMEPPTAAQWGAGYVGIAKA